MNIEFKDDDLARFRVLLLKEMRESAIDITLHELKVCMAAALAKFIAGEKDDV